MYSINSVIMNSHLIIKSPYFCVHKKLMEVIVASSFLSNKVYAFECMIPKHKQIKTTKNKELIDTLCNDMHTDVPPRKIT